MFIADEVAREFAEQFNGYCADEIAARLACSEVDALAALLTALGDEELAATWIEYHAEGDDEDEDHYRPPS
ncbi:hypothetical protein C1I98_13365 [Spongiactinospora gelatinilytica]|uniref:Uncharacterized protein n=1 Tax=Spongiactinospora gelatinilytica TaxID=2666298 RepID=A0A2W2IAU5_9ACTN|nr:hypothetical protein [Spongiactinospora gelatinilytica]PZG47454.1 hypothetical protein C1I98_13365 [Spongiactinospora gelatinilytica]